MEYVRIREICVRLEIGEDVLREWAREGLITLHRATDADEVAVSAEDAERLRVIAVLTREMDVNLAGVEVILHMREDLVAMRQQFDDVLQGLVSEVRKRVRG